MRAHARKRPARHLSRSKNWPWMSPHTTMGGERRSTIGSCARSARARWQSCVTMVSRRSACAAPSPRCVSAKVGPTGRALRSVRISARRHGSRTAPRGGRPRQARRRELSESPFFFWGFFVEVSQADTVPYYLTAGHIIPLHLIAHGGFVIFFANDHSNDHSGRSPVCDS